MGPPRFWQIAAVAALATVAGESAIVWQPVPYVSTVKPAAPKASLQERWVKADVLGRGLEERSEAVERTAAEISSTRSQAAEWERDLVRRERELECQRDSFRRNWVDQETSMLHLIVFRLVRIQATASGVIGELDDSQSSGASEPPFALEVPHTHLEDVGKSPVHLRWSEVEIVTCFPGDLNVVAGEIPVHNILRATTPLPVRNLCGLHEDGRPPQDLFELLLLLAQHLSWAGLQPQGALPVLYYVVFDTNVFFNRIEGAPANGGGRNTPASRTAASVIAARYESAVVEGHRELQRRGADLAQATSRPVVAAAEDFCRDGRDFPCGHGEAEPPFLRAASLAGPGDLLVTLIREVEALGLARGERDASSLLRDLASRRPSDIVPDSSERLFGSLVRAVPGPCSETEVSGAWCPPDAPCCPTGHAFHRMHESHHLTEGCALHSSRRDEPPISWHGDGLAKWSYVLAIHSLATSCQRIARLVLMNHPVDMLDHLFRAFSATQTPGSGGWM